VLIRYKTDSKGKLIKQAEVYTREEHRIDRGRLDQDAVKIVRRLQKADHEAYIVGGAVRDLLMDKEPKDFDISTSAEPSHIRKLFRNSRVIGKRFRLVHIFFRDRKIIEVSTFRSAESQGFQNVFGEIEEDALRRDFSMNALYYDPVKDQVIDFVGGFADIKARSLKAVIPHKRIFVEDPVRIIRAIKYAVKTGLNPGFFLKRKMKAQAELLADVSYSRLTEEIYKILAGGESGPTFREFYEYRVLSYILPGIDEIIRDPSPGAQENRSRFFANLDDLDRMIAEQREVPRNIMIQQLVKDFVMRLGPWTSQKKIHFPEVYQGIKELVKPMVPANRDVEDVVVSLMRERQESMGQRKSYQKGQKRRRSRPRRRRKPASKNPLTDGGDKPAE
jgi:poly(A) polymerase